MNLGILFFRKRQNVSRLFYKITAFVDDDQQALTPIVKHCQFSAAGKRGGKGEQGNNKLPLGKVLYTLCSLTFFTVNQQGVRLITFPAFTGQ
ncbi:hypothetical protein CE195_05680 [Sodalis-like symbiont of Philaenus spumarius]|nr:hypothetical protein CE195_05680 [Sodalis-like symbiont of Philaenus spumarius]